MEIVGIGTGLTYGTIPLLFIGLIGCATQATAKDDVITPRYIPLHFHELVEQLAAEMPTSLERIQGFLGFMVPMEDDDGRWQTYQPRNLVTADGVYLASIELLVRNPELKLKRIFINFEQTSCFSITELRKEFSMNDEYLYDNPLKAGQGFYNDNYVYSFMVASQTPPRQGCAGSIVITTSDPTKP